MATQMRRFNHAALIWSCDVLSHQVCAQNSAEYSAELQQGKVEGVFLVPNVFTDTDDHELLYVVCNVLSVNYLRYTGFNVQNSTFL
jgi:hypothetical protein